MPASVHVLLDPQQPQIVDAYEIASSSDDPIGNVTVNAASHRQAQPAKKKIKDGLETYAEIAEDYKPRARANTKQQSWDHWAYDLNHDEDGSTVDDVEEDSKAQKHYYHYDFLADDGEQSDLRRNHYNSQRSKIAAPSRLNNNKGIESTLHNIARSNRILTRVCILILLTNITLLVLLGAGGVYFMNGLDKLSGNLGTISNMADVITSAVNGVNGTISKITNDVSSAVNTFNVFSKNISSIYSAAGNLSSIVSGINGSSISKMVGDITSAVNGVNGTIAMIVDQVTSAVNNGFSNAFSDVFGGFSTLLPSNLFDMVSRIFAYDFPSAASKLASAANNLALEMRPNASEHISAYIYIVSSLISDFATVFGKFKKIPDPTAIMTNSTNTNTNTLLEKGVINLANWIQNQTNSNSIHNAGSSCINLLTQMQSHVAGGDFQFQYPCLDVTHHKHYLYYPWYSYWNGTAYVPQYYAFPNGDDDDTTYKSCGIRWNTDNTNHYIGNSSIAYQICKLLLNIQL